MLEWYKNLSEEEQELFEEDLIGMLTAFTEYIKKRRTDKHCQTGDQRNKGKS